MNGIIFWLYLEVEETSLDLSEMLLLPRKSWTALSKIQSPGTKTVKLPLVYLGKDIFQRATKWWKDQN